MYIELTAPLDVLGFSRVTLGEGTSIEFERTVSVFDHRSVPIVISGTDVDDTVDAIRETRFVEDVTLVDEDEYGSVYRLTWAETLPELLTSIREIGGTILSAVAVDDEWTFELRFPERGASHFYAQYRESEHPITILRVCRDATTRPSRHPELTEKQREVLVHAFETGYFDVPRRTTTVDLARAFDISDTAVSQRLRRGISTVLREVPSTTRAGRGTDVQGD